ncbi:MAG: PAS domain-containing protein, partial [Deltaproteobacteria bacterium]|nr:PAS domain-containing protein [Deltaproteobacteria bacterium]
MRTKQAMLTVAFGLLGAALLVLGSLLVWGAPELAPRQRLVLMLSCTLLALVPLAVVFCIHLVLRRKLELLLQAAGRIAQGQLDAPLPALGSGEPAQLGRVLGWAAGELRRSISSHGQIVNILGSMVDPLLVVSPDLAIRMVNAATCNLLGFSEAELIGRSMTTIFCRKEQPLALEHGRLDQISKGLSFLDFDISLRTRSGELIPVQVSFSGLHDHRGGYSNVLLVARDLREARKLFAAEAAQRELSRYNALLEDQVQARTAELAQANRELEENLRKLRSAHAQLVQADRLVTVGTLAAGVAHETNNPLAYVLANLDYTRQELEEVSR